MYKSIADMKLTCLLSLAFIKLSYSQLTCPQQCELSKCEPFDSSQCPAGATVDRCQCCPICAKGEGDVCDLNAVKGKGVFTGSCGDNLQCVKRDDISKDIQQGICRCVLSGEVCGSDGKTYENLCQMRSAPLSSNDQIVTLKHRGRCQAGAQIITSPKNIETRIGKEITLLCEVTGNPVPQVVWSFHDINNHTYVLPGDDDRASVCTRGGPESYTATSWLQIQAASESHEGDYLCYASNRYGTDEAGFRLKVVRASEL